MSQTANEVKSVIKEWSQDALSNVHTALPAIITAYDAGNNRASCKPVGTMRTKDGRNIPYPVVHNVPVVFPTGRGGKAGCVFPIRSGDGCLLVFSEAQAEDFLSGGVSKDLRRHSLNDGICIPGLYSGGVTAHPRHTGETCAYNGSSIIRISESAIVAEAGGSVITLDGAGFRGNVAGTSFDFSGGNCVINGVGVTSHTHTGVHGETTTGHG